MTAEYMQLNIWLLLWNAAGVVASDGEAADASTSTYLYHFKHNIIGPESFTHKNTK